MLFVGLKLDACASYIYVSKYFFYNQYNLFISVFPPFLPLIIVYSVCFWQFLHIKLSWQGTTHYSGWDFCLGPSNTGVLLKCILYYCKLCGISFTECAVKNWYKTAFTVHIREGLKKNNGRKSVLFHTRRVGGRVGGGRRSHSLGDFFAAQKPFVCLKEAPKQTLCSLLTSDMLDIASNSVLKTSFTISGT